MRRGAGLIEIATAVCAAVVAIATLAPRAAQATTTREFAIHRGVTTIDMRVRHTTGTRPPAIVFSTRPGRLSCRVLGYHYGNLNRAGRFALRLRCSGVPRRARGRLVFRAPFVRSFPLHNGGNAVRVRIDEPRGNARPLGELTTGARNHACRVTRTSSRTFEGQFIASARVGCRGLRVKTRGTLAIGGLVAAVRVQAQPVSSRSARPSASITQSTAGAVAADSCDMVHQVVIPSQPTVLYKDCFGGPFRLGPWQSQFVGLGGPSFGCEPGWSRSVPALKAPAAWLLVGRTTVDLVTDPEDAWWYSYVRIAGLVTNWQFRGDITFRFTYRCFQVQ